MPWVCGLPPRSALPPTRALWSKYCFVRSRNWSAPLPVSAAIDPSCQARKRLHMSNKEALVITSVIDRKKIKPNRRSLEVLNPDRFIFCTDASMPMHAVFAMDECFSDHAMLPTLVRGRAKPLPGSDCLSPMRYLDGARPKLASLPRNGLPASVPPFPLSGEQTR